MLCLIFLVERVLEAIYYTVINQVQPKKAVQIGDCEGRSVIESTKN